MATWNDLATQGFSSASSLFQAGHWRGAINRAYYADVEMKLRGEGIENVLLVPSLPE